MASSAFNACAVVFLLSAQVHNVHGSAAHDVPMLQGSSGSEHNVTVEKESLCYTRCSPVHFCRTVLYSNNTALISCEPCTDVCPLGAGGVVEDDDRCRRYCPDIWEALSNGSSESLQWLQTSLQEYSQVIFHGILLPVPDPKYVNRTVSGLVACLLFLVGFGAIRKGIIYIADKYDYPLNNDLDPILGAEEIPSCSLPEGIPESSPSEGIAWSSPLDGVPLSFPPEGIPSSSMQEEIHLQDITADYTTTHSTGHI